MSEGKGAATEPDRRHWVVELDEERCTLCEACTKHCPTGALRADKDAQRLSLLFDASLCDGCPKGEGCEESCVEQALRRTDSGSGQPTQGPVLLLEGPTVRCAQCEEIFGSVRKLQKVADKGHADVVADLCPVCRRTKLVVRFIDEERMPDGKAEYRSTHEILRQAGHLAPKPPKGQRPPADD